MQLPLLDYQGRAELLRLKVGVLAGYVCDAWTGFLWVQIVVAHDNRTGIAPMQIFQ
jgi:hypothetical protein